MLRVIVESASGIPQKRLGNPDPIAAVIFRGERFVPLIRNFFSFFSELGKPLYAPWRLNKTSTRPIVHNVLKFLSDYHLFFLSVYASFPRFWHWFTYKRLHPYKVRITLSPESRRFSLDQKAWSLFIPFSLIRFLCASSLPLVPPDCKIFIDSSIFGLEEACLCA